MPELIAAREINFVFNDFVIPRLGFQAGVERAQRLEYSSMGTYWEILNLFDQKSNYNRPSQSSPSASAPGLGLDHLINVFVCANVTRSWIECSHWLVRDTDVLALTSTTDKTSYSCLARWVSPLLISSPILVLSCTISHIRSKSPYLTWGQMPADLPVADFCKLSDKSKIKVFNGTGTLLDGRFWLCHCDQCKGLARAFEQDNQVVLVEISQDMSFLYAPTFLWSHLISTGIRFESIGCVGIFDGKPSSFTAIKLEDLIPDLSASKASNTGTVEVEVKVELPKLAKVERTLDHDVKWCAYVPDKTVFEVLRQSYLTFTSEQHKTLQLRLNQYSILPYTLIEGSWKDRYGAIKRFAHPDILSPEVTLTPGRSLFSEFDEARFNSLIEKAPEPAEKLRVNEWYFGSDDCLGSDDAADWENDDD